MNWVMNEYMHNKSRKLQFNVMLNQENSLLSSRYQKKTVNHHTVRSPVQKDPNAAPSFPPFSPSLTHS
jgi:hypothetical protein